MFCISICISIYLEHLVPLLKLDINILSILHYLVSPLGFCTLIFDLMRYGAPSVRGSEKEFRLTKLEISST